MPRAEQMQVTALLDSLSEERLAQMTEAELDEALAILGIDTIALLEGVAKLVDQARAAGKIADHIEPLISSARVVELFHGRSRSSLRQETGDNTEDQH